MFNKRFNAIKGVVNSIKIKRSSKEVMAERDENIVKIFVNKDLSLESKEVFLKKAIIYKPHFDLDINIDLLIEFYKRNKKWHQLLILCYSLINLINNHFAHFLSKDRDSSLKIYLEKLTRIYNDFLNKELSLKK